MQFKKKKKWVGDLSRYSQKKTYKWLKSTRTSLTIKENANQNYNEVAPHIDENSHY